MGSTAVAVGLLVDNLRLRGELETVAASGSAGSSVAVSPKARAKSRAASSSRAAVRTTAQTGRQDRTAVEPSGSAVETRIEAEVQARLGDAVEARLDQDLDAIVEERVEARMDEQHDRRRARLREFMEEHVSEYAEENGLSEETKVQLSSVVEASMSSLGDVFTAMRNEDIDRETARDEMGAIRDEMETSLAEVMGVDEADNFVENLRGPLGRRWRR